MEIEDLVYEYAAVIDQKRFDDLRGVFTEDAHIDYSEVGGPVGRLRTLARPRTDDLERDLAVEIRIDRPVDDAHAALAGRAERVVAIAGQGAQPAGGSGVVVGPVHAAEDSGGRAAPSLPPTPTHTGGRRPVAGFPRRAA